MSMVAWPAKVIWITPPQMQLSFELLFSAGIFPSMTVDEPGAHGAGVTGTQGMGVRTPNAAEVAEATVGFEMDEHTPNGGMFTIGLPSMMLAKGVFDDVRFAGSTLSTAGAAPKLH